jgi:hypothetical protein
VQVDPMKPKLKPPGTKRLKLNCDIPLSTSAFKLNLRRYIEGLEEQVILYSTSLNGGGGPHLHFSPQPDAFLSLKPCEARNVSHKKC